jgi:hypothetical protein
MVVKKKWTSKQAYDRADLLDNFFIPSLKLKEKIKNSPGKVIRRTYDNFSNCRKNLQKNWGFL